MQNQAARDFQAAVHCLDLIPLGTDFSACLISPAKPAGFATAIRRQWRRGLMTNQEMQLELGLITLAEVKGPTRVARPRQRR